jgi:hypothetical protein
MASAIPALDDAGLIEYATADSTLLSQLSVLDAHVY